MGCGAKRQCNRTLLLGLGKVELECMEYPEAWLNGPARHRCCGAWGHASLRPYGPIWPHFLAKSKSVHLSLRTCKKHGASANISSDRMRRASPFFDPVAELPEWASLPCGAGAYVPGGAGVGAAAGAAKL